MDAQLTHQLLTIPNPHRTGKLQGMLLLHENMVVRLADVLAPHLGLVKDKLAVVVKVDLHHADQRRLANLEPGFRQVFPEFMARGIWVKLLKGQNSPMEEALLQKWEELFPNVTEQQQQMPKPLSFVELVHADFKIDLKIGDETEKIEVIRWQCPLLHGMLRTAYSAQGVTLDGGVVLDLRRAGGLEDSDWWLAIYVLLTRGRTLENLILLGFTDQVEELLRRDPPPCLRQLTDKLEAKAGLPMMDSNPTLVVACPASSADNIPSLIQMVSHSVLACLISMLCCSRHDMSDSGGLQHVLACLFCSLNCKR